jgi:hypothetical protein
MEFGFKNPAIKSVAFEVPTDPDESVEPDAMGLVNDQGQLFFRMPTNQQEIILGRDHLGEDPSVSQFHVRFYRRSGGIFIQDMGSTNGTRVLRNGKEVYAYKTPPGERSKGYTMAVHPGDLVQMGNSSFYVY